MSKDGNDNYSQIKELEEQIKILKHINKENADLIKFYDTDTLTGLLIKDAFFRETQKFLNKNPNEQFIFLRFDIDKFQTVNSLFGYDEGDRLIQYCANELRKVKSMVKESVIGRIDADIFCLCIKFNEGENIVPSLSSVELFLEGFREDYRFNMSVGIYVIKDTSELLRDIYAKSSVAARKCKGNTTLHYANYDKEMDKEIVQQQIMSSEMHKALKHNEFVVHFQPKVDLKTQRLVGAEALVRWNHPTHGFIPPSDFIPTFYKNGFIALLDLYVFTSVCSCLETWKKRGLQLVPISINMTQVTMMDLNLPNKLFAIMNTYGIEKEYIHLEITEGSYSVDTEKSIMCAKEFHERGIHLEMDDFGTGISSLTMVHELPINTLKLDLRFIKSYSESKSNAGIIHFIVSLARQMELNLVAEGIENENQLEFLKNIGCDIGQGYFFSKAVSAKEFESILKTWESTHIAHTAPETHLPLNMNDLWIPDSNFNILFNAIAGPAAIYEATSEVLSVKVLKANDDYFQVMEVPRSGKHHTFEDLLQLIYGEDLAVLQKSFIESIQTKKSFSALVRRINLKGKRKTKWIKFNVRILFQTKIATLLLANLEDVTTQQEHISYLEREANIHDEYRKQLSIYRGAEASGLATMKLDDGIELVYANDAFLDMHGCSREYAFSNAKTILLDTVYPDDKQIVMEALQKVIKNKQDHFKWAMRIVTMDKKIIPTIATGIVRYENKSVYADIIVRPQDETLPVATHIGEKDSPAF